MSKYFSTNVIIHKLSTSEELDNRSTLSTNKHSIVQLLKYQHIHGHNDTPYSDVRRKPFSHTSALPEDTGETRFICIQPRRYLLVNKGTCTNEQQNEDKRFGKIKDGDLEDQERKESKNHEGGKML